MNTDTVGLLERVYCSPFSDDARLRYAQALEAGALEDQLLAQFIRGQLKRDRGAARLVKKLGTAALGSLSKATVLGDAVWSRGFPVSCRLKKVGLTNVSGLRGFATLIHLDFFKALGDPAVEFPQFLDSTPMPALRALESVHWTWLRALATSKIAGQLLELRNVNLATNQWAPSEMKREVIKTLGQACPALRTFEHVQAEPRDQQLLAAAFPRAKIAAFDFSKDRGPAIERLISEVEKREVQD